MLNNALYDMDGKLLYVALTPPELAYASRKEQFRFTLETALNDDVNLSLLSLKGCDYDQEEVSQIMQAFILRRHHATTQVNHAGNGDLGQESSV